MGKLGVANSNRTNSHYVVVGGTDADSLEDQLPSTLHHPTIAWGTAEAADLGDDACTFPIIRAEATRCELSGNRTAPRSAS